MMSALYVGATGMKTHDYGLQIVGHNLANVNTVAYKQQEWLFQDLMYKDLALGTSDTSIKNQQGMGSMENITRTIYTQGAQESTGNYTDLSINGTGFFKVQSETGEEYLTRAGDFIFDKEGFLDDPTGATLLAYPIDAITGEEGVLQPMQLDVVNNAPISPALPTSELSAQLNLGFTSNMVQSYETVTVPAPTPTDPDATTTEQVEVNPYFSLLESYDANSNPIMPEVAYSQPMTIYDNAGNKRDITFHFDSATEINGQRTVEFIATVPPESDAGGSGSKDGVLMSGTMTFSSSGQLINMSAFTPNGGDSSDLNNWTPASLNENGEALLSVNFDGVEGSQNIAVNFGAYSSAGWTNANVTAASVGSDISQLPTIGVPPEFESYASTNYPSSSSNISNYVQDGAGQGELTSIYFDSDGTVVGNFTNGKSADLYRIPIYRVTSQDGLRNDGNNHYQTTMASGLEEEGIAGTENYGTISGSTLETSNVDMEREMTSMIILQRGFQSNSKSITTADEMLSKAIDLKR